MSCDPLARLLFIGTWCESDSAGRFKFNSAQLKARYLPGDDCDMEALVKQLEDRKMIERYEADGVPLCQVTNFALHQVINNRERPSELPAPDSVSKPKLKATTGKEGRNGVVHATSTPLSRVSPFEFWYDLYPKKSGKVEAERRWKKITPDDARAREMVEAIRAQIKNRAQVEQHNASTRGEGIFLAPWKNPATWLNQGCWDDDLIPIPGEGQSEHGEWKELMQ